MSLRQSWNMDVSRSRRFNRFLIKMPLFSENFLTSNFSNPSPKPKKSTAPNSSTSLQAVQSANPHRRQQPTGVLLSPLSHLKDFKGVGSCTTLGLYLGFLPLGLLVPGLLGLLGGVGFFLLIHIDYGSFSMFLVKLLSLLELGGIFKSVKVC